VLVLLGAEDGRNDFADGDILDGGTFGDLAILHLSFPLFAVGHKEIVIAKCQVSLLKAAARDFAFRFSLATLFCAQLLLSLNSCLTVDLGHSDIRYFVK